MALSKVSDKHSWMLTFASILVVIAALYLGKGILVPVTLAALLSFLLSPVCSWLERRGLGRIPAVLMTAVLGFSLLGVVTWTAAMQITSLAPKIPEYQRNLEEKLSSVNTYAVAALGSITSTTQGMGEARGQTDRGGESLGGVDRLYSVRVVSSPSSPLQIFGGLFGPLLEVLGSTGIVIVLVVFFLVQREDLRDRFIHLMGKGQVTVTTQMLEDAGGRVSRYLSMLFLINGAFGICVCVGLYLIGVPNAILWGILAATLRFIPYIGPWIAAAMPLGLAMAISPGWFAPLITVGLFVVLELFNNNFLEPWLYGRNTGVSAVAVLLAAVFWMWLWGPVGLLLATPLTVCLLVVGKHVSQLSFFDILLGTDPVFEPKDRIYQRLLAGDQEEAEELFEQYLEHLTLVEVYDAVFIPAMALVETYWQLGELNESKHTFMLECLRELIREQGERKQEIPTKVVTAVASQSADETRRVDDPIASQLSILSVPARNDADEIAGMMLAQVLETTGYRVKSIAVSALTGQMLEIFEPNHPADFICISATPPAAVMHARYLCRRLRDQIPNVKLLVGLWDYHGDLNKAQERIGCEATVVTTLADAQAQVRLLSPPHLLQPEARASEIGSAEPTHAAASHDR